MENKVVRFINELRARCTGELCDRVAEVALAAITMFTLMAIYDPRSRKDLKKWVKLLGITAAFITVMYLMFATLLGVFTPREIWLR